MRKQFNVVKKEVKTYMFQREQIVADKGDICEEIYDIVEQATCAGDGSDGNCSDFTFKEDMPSDANYLPLMDAIRHYVKLRKRYGAHFTDIHRSLYQGMLFKIFGVNA